MSEDTELDDLFTHEETDTSDYKDETGVEMKVEGADYQRKIRNRKLSPFLLHCGVSMT